MAATAGMSGLSRGGKELVNVLEERSEYLNIPRVGIKENFAFPQVQLNVASAVEPEDGKHSRSQSLERLHSLSLL